MAIADSVPGVSGGTIAYILKQYENLFKHINKIIKFDFNSESIKYLIKLALGWIIGFISAVFVITSIFESHIYQISSLFMGLIIISLYTIITKEKEVLNWNLKNILVTILAVFIVCMLVVFQNSQLISISIDNLNIFSYIYLFIVGFVAISAMLLPGISGSSILMIFGIYFLIMDSIHSFLTLDFSTVPLLMCFGLGILSGGIFAVKVISSLFENHKSLMTHLILGLLMGSIIAIINGPSTIEGVNLANLNFNNFSIIFFVIGLLIIILLDLFALKVSKNN